MVKNGAHQKVVLFDGVCNLCNSGVQFIIRHDARRQFLFGSLQGEAGQAYLKKFNLPADSLHSFILIEGEQVYTHSTAALRVLKHLGGGWKLFYGLIIIPKFARDGMYNFIARNRYKWFGKKEACWIPQPGLQSRFLD
jgi:predicted DCC family thiol-disulfide oxidoreductase YuxK